MKRVFSSFLTLRNPYTVRYKMSVVSVRSIDDENDMKISFTYEGKPKNLQRSKTESLSKSLVRIGLSALDSKKKDKKAAKKSKQNSTNARNQPDASLWFQNCLVDQDLQNTDAWLSGSVLRIGDKEFTVVVNPPTVLSILLPSHIMVGFPVYPVIKLEFAELKYCTFSWFKSQNPEASSAACVPPIPECNWEQLSEGFCYKPTLLDIGCYLKLVCVAGQEGCSSSIKTEAITSVKISAAVGHCPFENRHLYTTKRLDSGHIRCVSYNILADAYAREEFALNVLYPYCPPYALDIGYRKQVIMKEVTGYNADILCLQECGRKLFERFLDAFMGLQGYQGLLKCKAGKVPEGEAIFFDRSKFELVENHDIVLRESLLQDPAQENILDHISSIPTLLENLLKKTSIAQVVVLKSKDSADKPYLCVVNTHLYYKPCAPHIRLLQAAIILNHTKKVIETLKKSSSKTSEGNSEEHNTASDMDVAVLFCGDFNSNPKTGLVQLFTEGHVERSHHDWSVTEDEDQHCNTLDLDHGFDLSNACGTPPFTNYTGGFKGTLDYIFCDKRFLEVEAVVPMPDEEELSNYTALPSIVMPSDHLALVCDLKWK